MPRFADPIDLAQNELQNAKIQNLSSAPENPAAGQPYFDTTLTQFGVWNGSQWVYLVAGGGDDKTFDQAFVNESSVSVAHNLGKFPAVTVIDSTDDEVFADVQYVDLNHVTLDFSAPVSGTVTCN